jgi:hypothetical protein
MKSHQKIIIALLCTSLYFLSCSNASNYQATEASSSTEAASLPDTAMQPDRIIIKTADITMDVNNVEQSIQDFQYMLQAVNGHIYHYEIHNEKQNQTEVQHSFDSNLVATTIAPIGYLKVKVPVGYADSFISQVISMNGQINDFMFDENDVTESITEKKELMLSDAGEVSHAKKNASLEKQYYDKETRESFIARKADFSKLAFQTKNLWFDIHLKGSSYVDKTYTASTENYRTPFYVRATQALNNGWYGFSIFLTLILQMWPFIIVAFVVYWAFKKKWFHRHFALAKKV